MKAMNAIARRNPLPVADMVPPKKDEAPAEQEPEIVVVAPVRTRRPSRTAEQRRRVVLAVLFGTLALDVLAVVLGFLPAWSLALPGTLLVSFVVMVRRQLKARRRVTVKGAVRSAAARPEEAAVEYVAEDAVQPETWQPINHVSPTYAMKPAASAVPRNIDRGLGWNGQSMVAEAEAQRRAAAQVQPEPAQQQVTQPEITQPEITQPKISPAQAAGEPIVREWYYLPAANE